MKKILIAGACSALASNFIRNALYQGGEYKISAFDKLISEKHLDNLYVNRNMSFNIADMNDTHVLKRIIQYEQPDILIDFSPSVKTVELEKELSYLKKYVLVSDYFSTNKIQKESFELDNMFIIRFPKLYGPRQLMHEPIPQLLNAAINNVKVDIDTNPMQDEYWMHIFDAIKNVQTMVDYDIKELNAYGTQCFNYLDIQQRLTKITNREMSVSFSNKPVVPLDLKTDACQQQFVIHKGLDQSFEWYQNNKWIFK